MPFFIQSKRSTVGTLSGDLVIDIKGGGTTAGISLDVFTKKKKSPDWDNQIWTHEADSSNPGWHYLRAQLPKPLVIDIQGGSTSPGASLDIWTLKTASQANQLWRFIPESSGTGYYFILSMLGNLVIGVDDSGKKTGLVTDKLKAGADYQLWKLVDEKGKDVTPPSTKPKLTLAAGRGDFSFEGVLFVPGTKVKVTSSFSSLGGSVWGGPWTYTVDDGGSFAADISVD
jgi:Ricin-type beta-trefoil lectin domain.